MSIKVIYKQKEARSVHGALIFKYTLYQGQVLLSKVPCMKENSL